MIEVDSITKAFGEVQALNGVSFSAKDARVTGLLGPNGAGKSTTLRVLYTVIQPDAGSASIDGIDVLKDPVAVRQRIGVLPHGAGVYPNLTARENTRYYGRLHGLKGQALEKRIAHLFEMLEMGEFADRRAKGFSHGQRTKVALARALVHEPRNVILDEPTSGLDVMATRSLRELILRLRGEGYCVLFSSHVMQEVAALCDDIVIIAHGRAVAAGSPDSLRQAAGHDDLEDVFVSAISKVNEP